MHLSISSSELRSRSFGLVSCKVGPRHAIIVAITSVVFVISSAELMARYAFPHISHIEGRIRSDEQQVWSIRRPSPASSPVVLIVGNSLLLRGLNYSKIRSEMAPHLQVVRFGIENTEYLDWYYGLHHLFTSGVRPSTVLLCLSMGQMVSTKTLGDYSARHLFGVPELLPVAHEAGMDATRTSGLMLAHWSSFYASRATIRNFILNRTAPGYAGAMHTLADSIREPLPSDEKLISNARARASAIHKLCQQYNAELVILVPPSLGTKNNLLVSAAHLEQVNVDNPLPTGSLGPEFFRPDRTHLNEKGAEVFTKAVIRYLQTHFVATGRSATLRNLRGLQGNMLPIRTLVLPSRPVETLAAK
jgi:hypothetical protein